MSARPYALLACLVLFACRDGAVPYEVEPFSFGTEDLRRLTYGVGNEMDPRWSLDGDSVYYHSDLWFDRPVRGAMLRAPADGGVATLVESEIHGSASVFLAHPTPAPDGEHIAYVQMVRVVPPAVCPAQMGPMPASVSPPLPEFITCTWPEPQLDSAVVRVRALSADGDPVQDEGTAIRFGGVDARQWRRDTTKLTQTLYPFEFEWLGFDELTSLRPSWSPDGQSLVFSNGVRLFLWRVGDASATPIPNTEDGVAPAWSPDGQRIAFVVNERAAATMQICVCEPFPPREPTYERLVVHQRTIHPLKAQQLVIIEPSGANRTILTEGRDPAWSPDGRVLYFARGRGEASALYQLDVGSGTGVTAVLGTAGGRAPAVSPDGARLAFTRWIAVGQQDVWVMRIGT